MSSLSDLRDLQRQAKKQSKQKAPTAPNLDPESSSDAARQAANRKRSPHRFLPPGSGTVLAPPPIIERFEATETQPDNPPDVHPDDHPEGLTAEDIALFRRVVQSVTPAAQSNRAVLPPIPAAAGAQLRQRRQHAAGQPTDSTLEVSDHYAPADIDHDDTLFLQTGHGPHLIKGLKKGKWPIQANLDLHGANLDNARERMDRFIQSCRDHQIRCVRIVHGKGHGSKNGDPVLKETVRRWLSQLAVVQAYIECDEADGGAGAVLVLFAKQKS